MVLHRWYNQRLSHGILINAQSINPRPHYHSENFSSQANNGLWLILRATTKIRVIICLSHIPINQLKGKSLSHMQTLGYWGKWCSKYVIIYNYWLLRHWTWCDIDLRVPILTEAEPRSILVLSGPPRSILVLSVWCHIMSNAPIVNNCFII